MKLMKSKIPELWRLQLLQCCESTADSAHSWFSNSCTTSTTFFQLLPRAWDTSSILPSNGCNFHNTLHFRICTGAEICLQSHHSLGEKDFTKFISGIWKLETTMEITPLTNWKNTYSWLGSMKLCIQDRICKIAGLKNKFTQEIHVL